MVRKIRDDFDGMTFQEIGGSATLTIDPDACVACGLCIPECPSSAFAMPDDKLVFYPDSCSVDGACADVCPMGALTFHESAEDCAETQMDQFMAETTVDSTDVSIALDSASNNSRTVTYSWRIYSNIFNYWTYIAFEKGTHKKVVKNGVEEWNWDSLEHKNITFDGISAIWAMSVSINATDTAIGTYYSGQKHHCSFHLALACEGGPLNSSRMFTAEKVWHVDAPHL